MGSPTQVKDGEVGEATIEHPEIAEVYDLEIEAAGSEPFSEDEFYPESVTSDFASASSSVYAHTYEKGRRYQTFKNSRYPIPNDDQEQMREDMKHAMLMELTDGKLFYSPVGTHPQKIVDIGTGTGKPMHPPHTFHC